MDLELDEGKQSSQSEVVDAVVDEVVADAVSEREQALDDCSIEGVGREANGECRPRQQKRNGKFAACCAHDRKNSSGNCIPSCHRVTRCGVS